MKYIISAGGTGGHIYPALHLAQKLIEDGDEVIFIASNRNVDHQILDHIKDIDIRFYQMDGLSRSLNVKSIYKNIKNIFYTLNVLAKSNKLLKNFKPDYVIGFGGFVTYPILDLAVRKKIKTAIHEQNSYPGLVNRKLASKVDCVFYTFDSSIKYFENAKKLVFSSNPRGDVAQSYDLEHNKENNILLVGGSLGAESINNLGFELAKNSDFNVTLICGERFYEENIQNEIPSNLTLLAYSDSLIEMFNKNELVIARAGATTLVELVYSSTLCIAIPSPNVVANHQEINAREYQKLGLIDVVLESEINTGFVISKIRELLKNKEHYYKKMEDFSDINSVEVIKKELNND